MEERIMVKNLELRLEESSQVLRLIWLGEADERYPGDVVRPFLYRAKDHAVSSCQRIVLDFSSLEFMNSSFIGTVTNLVTAISDEGVEVEIIFNTTISWQDLSNRAFSIIFSKKDNVTVVDLTTTQA